MRPHRKRSPKQPGAAPGTLVYQGDEPLGPVKMRVFDYDAGTFQEKVLDSPAECARFRQSPTVTWIDVEGVQEVGLVEQIGARFGVHPLTLEDIVNTRQRPKIEEYPGYVYVVLKMLHYRHDDISLEDEQVSLILGKGFLLSFQETKEGDVFDPVRQRLREGKGRIRQMGANYLAYTLIDLVVDHYLGVLEGLGEHIEALEDQIVSDPTPEVLRRINHLRRHVLFLRRSIWPLREVVATLARNEQPLVSPEINLFFRDVYDHAIRTTEFIEASRELLASMTELYLSTLSIRMNEVMKVLAIISTFFLPLTFIAGLYGMNFNPEASPLNMPELNWYFGYPFALGIMIVLAVVMYAFFRHKRWL